ncbi:MAG: DUF4019 domain-containing protein [Deltaproteobacteria bacterium]|nr:DUF4019 domain-containing protein [Deltaproteobacteria bacterium]
MRRLFAIAAVLLLGLSTACDLGGGIAEPANVIGGNGGPEKERRAALTLAAKFVETLDRGERITPMLAASLREQATDDALDAMFNGFRSWTGAFEKRSAFAYGYSETVPELPPGRYFTVLYRSHFERGNVEERVIVAVDENGESVAGYSQSKRILYSDGAAPPPASQTPAR